MLTAQGVLDHYFLEARCQLIELAAMLDRFDRAADGQPLGPDDRARIDKLYEALGLLSARNSAPNRAERVLNLFTDPA